VRTFQIASCSLRSTPPHINGRHSDTDTRWGPTSARASSLVRDMSTSVTVSDAPIASAFLSHPALAAFNVVLLSKTELQLHCKTTPSALVSLTWAMPDTRSCSSARKASLQRCTTQVVRPHRISAWLPPVPLGICEYFFSL